MGKENRSTGEMIVKANTLVQAKMPLSRMEHRIVGALISQLDKDDEEFGHQKIWIKDLMEASGISSQNLYNLAEDICSSLLSKKLEIKEMEGGKRKYTGISLLTRCEYLEGDGYIEARFNEEMKPYLLQLKRRFTMYEAGHFLPLRSTHSMRIYELLKMREDISILRITVSEFRDILGVENKYSRFSDLKRSVIEKARGELSEKTDISFTYDVERDGQIPKRIKFFIHGQSSPGAQPEMEDRTDAPDLDVVNLFLSELSQEEINALDEETVTGLYKEALQKAKSQESGAASSRVQYVAYRIMLNLWRDDA
jgi:Protein involved in initiation of plasmid replication